MYRQKKPPVESLLNSHGIICTPQRRQVAEILLRKQQHLCIEDIFQQSNQRHRNISRATVYNTINLFVQKKLIRKVFIDSEHVFYDTNTEDHHHFYNEDTGELMDFNITDNALISDLPLPDQTIKTNTSILIKVKNHA